MAGKKGRSGRKKKIQPVAAQKQTQTGQTQQVTVQQPAADPFLKIESELSAQVPSPAGAPAGQGTQTAALPRKAPENLVKFIWKTLYGFEDYGARLYLGLGDQFRGVFLPQEQVVADHVAPTCQILEKYVSPDILQSLDEKMPEISLGICFLEAQLGFFAKLQQAKQEIAEKKNETKQEIKPAQEDSQFNHSSYPKKGEA